MQKTVSLPFMLLGILFNVCLVASNLLETKVIQLGPITATAGLIVFPISYIINMCRIVGSFIRLGIQKSQAHYLEWFRHEFSNHRFCASGYYFACSTFLGGRRKFQFHIRSGPTDSYCQSVGFSTRIVSQCLYHEQNEGSYPGEIFFSQGYFIHDCRGECRLTALLSTRFRRTDSCSSFTGYDSHTSSFEIPL